MLDACVTSPKKSGAHERGVGPFLESGAQRGIGETLAAPYMRPQPSLPVVLVTTEGSPGASVRTSTRSRNRCAVVRAIAARTQPPSRRASSTR